MKIKFRIAIVLFAVQLQILMAAQVTPDPNLGFFYIAPKMDLQIDGNLDEWRQLLPVKLDREGHVKYNQNDWQGANDCSVNFWWGWNDWGFALAAETVDDSIAFPFSNDKIWNNDCIQFAIDVLDDNSRDAYNPDDREFVITMIDSQAGIYEYSFSDHRESGIRSYPCAMRISGDTIRYELLIPWVESGVPALMGGKHIGVSLVAFDNDGGDFRGWLEWTAGVADKKFTLPYANVLLFDPQIRYAQAIVTQPFLAESDSLSFWVHSDYRRSMITYQLMEQNEILFRRKLHIRRKWTKISIPQKYLNWGKLRLEVASWKGVQYYDIAVWSKQHITEQIGYLARQTDVLKNLKRVDPSAHILVQYWVDWLQQRFSSAVTDFDYYNVMNLAEKRITQIPNLFMKRQVFFDREHRIAEKMFNSPNEKYTKRYLVYLPPDFKPDKKYPLFVFLHNHWENEDDMAQRLSQKLIDHDVPVIGLFLKGYNYLGLNHLMLPNLLEHLQDIKNRYPIDKKRICVIGEGSGGAEAIYYIRKCPDLFAAASLINADTDTNFNFTNLKTTPFQVFGNDQDSLFAEKLNAIGGKAYYTPIPDRSVSNKIYTSFFFRWMLTLKKNRNVQRFELVFDENYLTRAYWLQIIACEQYDRDGYVDAVCDSHHAFIDLKNIQEFSILPDRLPYPLQFPFSVSINRKFHFRFKNKQDAQFSFYKKEEDWNLHETRGEHLAKSTASRGPMAAIFSRPLQFIYSTIHDDPGFNQLTKKIARHISQRDRNQYLDHLIVADTVAAADSITTNLVLIGSERSNALLNKIGDKLAIRTREDSLLQFGRSLYYTKGAAAIYVYPNPLNPDFLILVAIATDKDGLENLNNAWDVSLDNPLFRFDYVVVENGVRQGNVAHWIDYGHFDNDWQVDWFRPTFTGAPQRWFNSALVGFDANQLSFNSNWKEGGKGSFTWKLYMRMELKYRQKRFEWLNTFYWAFGQISVQENEKWHSPEKSNDIIDFDSVLRFTLKKFIDPYFAFSMDTQLQEGYNPKTKELLSKFINPVKLSQTAGIARNVFNNKKFQTTTRLGYGAKEVIASNKYFRKLWTGDESKWMKIDGGFEWYTEIKSQFSPAIQWTNKLKLFQAIFSSISPEKDPEENWRSLDVYWEQMFTAQLTQYVLFNVVMKFLYDRDTSKGGQFLENASLGVSYKFN